MKYVILILFFLIGEFSYLLFFLQAAISIRTALPMTDLCMETYGEKFDDRGARKQSYITVVIETIIMAVLTFPISIFGTKYMIYGFDAGVLVGAIMSGSKTSPRTSGNMQNYFDNIFKRHYSGEMKDCNIIDVFDKNIYNYRGKDKNIVIFLIFKWISSLSFIAIHIYSAIKVLHIVKIYEFIFDILVPGVGDMQMVSAFIKNGMMINVEIYAFVIVFSVAMLGISDYFKQK